MDGGDPKYVVRRARNMAADGTLARAGVWKPLWGKW